VRPGRIMSIKNSSDTIRNRTPNLPTWSVVPQQTVPPRCLHTHMIHTEIRKKRNVYVSMSRHCGLEIQGASLARVPKLLSMYTVEQRGFIVRKYRQTGSFKACQTAFRTEFGERRAPSKCCIQKLVKKLETRGSRSNACRILLWGLLNSKVYKKYTPHSRTTQRRYTSRDSSRQRRHFGNSIPEFGRNAFKCAWT